MIEACGDKARADELTAKCKKFDKFEFKHVDLESAYNKAHEAAQEAVDDIEVLAFELEKNAAKDAPYRIKSAAKLALTSIHEYVVNDKASRVKELAAQLKSEAASAKKEGDHSQIVAHLRELQSILKEGVGRPVPNFFRIAYYITYSGQPVPDMPMDELNEFLLDYINKEFMLDFIADAKQGLTYSANRSYSNMEEAIKALRDSLPVFQKENLDHKECTAVQKELSAKVAATIDKLAITKDSLSYTFSSSLKGEINRYFTSIGKNAKAVKVYEKNKAKYDKLVARGKTPDYEVAAASVTDLELVKHNIVHIIERLADHYEEALAQRDQRDFDKETVDAIDYLMNNAAGAAAKVTKRMARDRAIKLMDEVGIAEPRKRYNQYPFEFSGGMRQRIVIAIALAANPDILICDEPTTALDVTIQAQILELINKLKRERQLSVIFITHDLGVVANMADRVAVMYAGKIVEYGTAEDVFYRAAHPYTWALLSSMPDLDTNEKLEAIPGTPPNMIYPPVGDAFAPRNKYAMQIDFERQPPMFQISDTHFAATWLLHPDAPKVDPPKSVLDRIARMNSKRGVDDAKQ
ncbi:MAG: oligopeptide/dipeptide ABC transporter ATP-binding protein [Candidatus Enterenecus sp.]